MTRRIDKPDTDADIELRKLLDSTSLAPFVMVAGAGSGKTTSLVKAISHVAQSRGVDLRKRSQKVACVTYTEVAVQEILGDVGDDPLLHISTIHSFLWSLAKPFQRDIAIWVEVRAREKLAAAQAEQANFSTRVQQKKRDETQSRIERYSDVLVNLSQVSKFTYGVGSDYSRGVLGHDDIIQMVPELIIERPLLAKLLARQHPFLFVDESQDTAPNVVEALKRVEVLARGEFCLGFFGDPMQQIYVSGVGDVSAEHGWTTITKPENFRSPLRVLDVVNRIRSESDGITQIPGLKGSNVDDSGSVTFFVLPSDEHRTANLLRVRQWLVADRGDSSWMSDGADSEVKILVIAHRMAARRLGFERLYSAFHDCGSESLKTSFDEGKAWPIVPFIQLLMPLYRASSAGKSSEVIQLLRRYSPLLDRSDPDNSSKISESLRSLNSSISELSGIITSAGEGSVRAILEYVIAHKILVPDPRLAAYFDPTSSDVVNSAAVVGALDKFMECDVAELGGYLRYIERESPYSTHQGVKGAEFENVIVVLDDEEGRHNQFSYEKLFGIKAPSKVDIEKASAGQDSIISRTRRLFYVCASRATKNLAVVLYASDVQAALSALSASGVAGADKLITINDLPV